MGAMTRLSFALLLVVVACGSPNRMNGDDGPETDALVECETEGAHRCQGATYQTCTGGVWQTAVDCPAFCVDALGCVSCSPGQAFCQDGNVWSCDDNGNPGAELMACGGQSVCIGGSCQDACIEAAASKSYIGCEYWAVDLDNAVEVWGTVGDPVGQGFSITPSFCAAQWSGTIATTNVCYESQGQSSTRGACDPPASMGGASLCPAGFACSSQQACVSNAQNSPFAIVVSNPQAKAANVVVTGPAGQTINRTIPAGAVEAILPQAGGAIPDQSVDGSTRALRAYKVVSDLPIVAYQFNPLDNADVFSNDASLLIPRAVFDVDYYVMTMPTLDRRDVPPIAEEFSRSPYRGFLTIVAWQDNTQVTVTPTVATTASATMQTIAANAPTTFTLAEHEVLQLQAAGAGDLTGTHITSPNMSTFGVFGGHEATAFGETTPPDTRNTAGPCCADHLEEMMFPSTTWGKTFAIARSQSRMTNENDTIRVMAQKPNTTMTFVPPPVSGTCGTLGPGGFCEVRIAGDTEISSNEPILVGHFLQSAIWRTPDSTPPPQVSRTGTGDPSMALAPPVEQHRKEYTILVPDKYEKNYVSIAAANTGGVSHIHTNPTTMMLQTDQVSLTPFPGSAHRAARIELTAGQHKFTCADGCGITVYGWSSGGVSYMFAGGLDLKPIVIL